MDLAAIATAIAATIGTVTVGSDTATATEQLPNAVGRIALLVYPPVGDLEVGVSRIRNDHYNFPVKLLLDPTDMPPRAPALYAWATALRDLVEMNLDLGLGYVAWAKPTAMRIEIDGEKYASVDGTYMEFDVVEINVRVLVREAVATVSM